MVKDLPSNSGDVRDVGLILALGRSPGGGNGTPVFLPGKFHEQRSLVGYSPRGAESDTTEHMAHYIYVLFRSMRFFSMKFLYGLNLVLRMAI